MKHQQLKNFQKVAMLNNMNKAAEILHITQPALSKSIRKLEIDLGIELFDRKGKSILLNANGKRILEHVDVILREYDAIYQISENNRYKRTVKILVKAADQLMTDIIFILNEKSTNIRIIVSHYQDLNEADIIITSGLNEYDNEDGLTVMKERLLLVVPLSHPLAKKNEVNLCEVADYPTVILNEDMPLRNDVLYWYRSVNTEPKIVYECDTCAILREMIFRGKGISLVPEQSWIFDGESKVKKIPIKNPQCYRYVNVICRNLTDKTVSRVYKYIVSSFERL